HSDPNTNWNTGYTLFSVMYDDAKPKFTGAPSNIPLNAVFLQQPGVSVPYVQDVVELENLGEIRPISGRIIFQQTMEIYYKKILLAKLAPFSKSYGQSHKFTHFQKSTQLTPPVKLSNDVPIERNQLRMSKSKKQIEEIKKELTEEDKLRLQPIDQALRNLSAPQQEIKADLINEEHQHEVRPKRHYNKNKYKEVERETAQVEPEEVFKNTFLAHSNLEGLKFVIDCIWRITTSRKRGDDLILNSDNFIKIWALITQEHENDIEIVLEEPLMQSHQCMAKKYEKKDLVRIMDVLIKNVSISVVDNVLWKSVEKLYRINKNFVRLSDKPTTEIDINEFWSVYKHQVSLRIFDYYFKQMESLMEPTEVQYMKDKNANTSNLVTIDTNRIVTGQKQFTQSIQADQFIKINGTDSKILLANGDTTNMGDFLPKYYPHAMGQMIIEPNDDIRNQGIRKMKNKANLDSFVLTGCNADPTDRDGVWKMVSTSSQFRIQKQEDDAYDYKGLIIDFDCTTRKFNNQQVAPFPTPPIDYAIQQSLGIGVFDFFTWGQVTLQNNRVYISIGITHSDPNTNWNTGYTLFSVMYDDAKPKFTGAPSNIPLNAVLFAQ
ncbi:MAG: hypothetical protein EZS28_031774, partial [Streblomastix strix]